MDNVRTQQEVVEWNHPHPGRPPKAQLSQIESNYRIVLNAHDNRQTAVIGLPIIITLNVLREWMCSAA